MEEYEEKEEILENRDTELTYAEMQKVHEDLIKGEHFEKRDLTLPISPPRKNRKKFRKLKDDVLRQLNTRRGDGNCIDEYIWGDKLYYNSLYDAAKALPDADTKGSRDVMRGLLRMKEERDKEVAKDEVAVSETGQSWGPLRIQRRMSYEDFRKKAVEYFTKESPHAQEWQRKEWDYEREQEKEKRRQEAAKKRRAQMREE